MENKLIIFFLNLGFILSSPKILANNQSIEDKNVIVINAASQKMAGIEITTLKPKELTALIPAPGEVIPNAISTTKVTTRVAAQVIQPHVQEGQHVKEGEQLVTMSSVDMAQTQGDLLLAAQDWERVKNLGKDAISGKRYSEAQVAYQRAYSTVLAYGMTEANIEQLLRTQKPSQAKGEFNLLAPRKGTVFNINFTEGELIEPGRVILQIVDEATVWVDAKLQPDLAGSVKVGDTVRIEMGNDSLTGRVIQVHHQLDETTRTRSIRVEVTNTGDLMHPGQFVNCQIEAGKTAPVLALPTEAIVRTADGDSAVYIEKKQDKFQSTEVTVVETIGSQTVIKGISEGTRVVTKGAFFVHSELNKQGFDANDH
jgi:RND family efflux transporter MFP subunit